MYDDDEMLPRLGTQVGSHCCHLDTTSVGVDGYPHNLASIPKPNNTTTSTHHPIYHPIHHILSHMKVNSTFHSSTMVKKTTAHSVKFKKAPGAPKRFKSAYMFFSEHQHKVIRENAVNKKVRDPMQMIYKQQQHRESHVHTLILLSHH